MWETNDGSVAVSSSTPTITVNGQTRDISAGASFKDTVVATAKEYGLGKFRLFLNDEEILPSQAPATIEAGMRIKLTPFDVAG